jgi:hypothetical protein
VQVHPALGWIPDCGAITEDTDQNMSRRVRGMSFSDLAFAEGCAHTAEWISDTVEELESFLTYDPMGCFIAESGQQPVGFCVATRLDKCGIIGVRTAGGDENERDCERDLLDHGVRYLLNYGCERIFSDTADDSVSAFESAGFIKACRIRRFVGGIYARTHQHVRSARSADLPAIEYLDRHSFKAERKFFLERRYSLAPQLCKVIEADEGIGGYIMARKGRDVVVVGPWVVTPQVDCPSDLLESLANEADGQKLLVEVLETNRTAAELLCAMGFHELPGSKWRLHYGRWSRIGLSDSLFAIGSSFIG